MSVLDVHEYACSCPPVFDLFLCVCPRSYLKHIKRFSLVRLSDGEHVNQVRVSSVDHEHPALDLKDRKYCGRVNVTSKVMVDVMCTQFAG